MDYFTLLNLAREPFSNSPDPDFFYQSGPHVACMQKLELALRLKRGLNVVIGAVGSGKTTICRRLLQRLSSDDSFDIHLILDPSYASPLAFLEAIASMLTAVPCGGGSEQLLKERIKGQLFKRGIDERKTVVLVIDEGQKLPEGCLERLRELLNYETNDQKLLQIVIFAQEEFQDILDRRANLADRVNLIHYLGPMSYADTRQMIRFRIDRASDHPRPPALFSWLALFAVYRATNGYPRKIINLCHQCVLALIVQNRTRVGWRLVQSCRKRTLAGRLRPERMARRPLYSLMAVLACVATGAVLGVRTGVLPPLSIFSMDGNLPPAAATAPRPPVLAASGSRPVTAAVLSRHATGPPAGTDAAVDDRGSTPAGASAAPSSPGAGQLPAKSDAAAVSPSNPPALDDPPPVADRTDRMEADAMPPLLGTLTVARNDTLGQMLMVVYGDYRSRFLKVVLEANPHIRNADAIDVGDAVRFPAVPIGDIQHPPSGWWLKVDDADSMVQAYREAKRYPALRMIAVWDRRAGMQYGIFVHGYFLSAAAADSAMAKLAQDLSATAEIVSGWPPDTVFFSDPFAGKGRHG